MMNILERGTMFHEQAMRLYPVRLNNQAPHWLRWDTIAPLIIRGSRQRQRYLEDEVFDPFLLIGGAAANA